MKNDQINHWKKSMEKIEYAIEEEHSIGGWYIGGWDEIGRTEKKELAEEEVSRLNKRNGNHYRMREIHLRYNAKLTK